MAYRNNPRRLAALSVLTFAEQLLPILQVMADRFGLWHTHWHSAICCRRSAVASRCANPHRDQCPWAVRGGIRFSAIAGRHLRGRSRGDPVHGPNPANTLLAAVVVWL